ncbi:D-aminoacyl-tRNA deacylase [Fundicoccus sp. Sow4_D5]|uniref:D-aminoacyl-tRNA deacylase n=1 Tax=Fundicoccus sp. Sow4_D5 TaxID=3438782 RepID=UPI003F8FACA1
MRVVIQKSLQSSVTIDQEITGQIEKGFVLLVGVTHEDTEEDAEYCARKIAKLRIFEDEDDKMNLSLSQVGGEILSISQFTLFANTRKGNRPSFTDSARPEQAEALYDYFNDQLKNQGFKVETGRFGAMMQVSILNDGPVTVLIDSKNP